MTTNDIIQIVNSMGFPIVCCGFFAWYMVRRDSQEKLRDDQHREEVTKLSEAINNNTLVMQKLLDSMGK